MSKLDPEQRKRLVSDAIGKMKFVQDAKAEMNDPMTRLLNQVAEILVDARVAVRPILKAGGGFDTAALKQIVFTCVRDDIHKRLDKDEQHMLLTILLSDNVMEDIKSNPFGNDKPDLLSGN